MRPSHGVPVTQPRTRVKMMTCLHMVLLRSSGDRVKHAASPDELGRERWLTLDEGHYVWDTAGDQS